MGEDSTHSETLESELQSEEAKDNPVHAQVEVSEVEETRDVSLAVEQCQPSVLEEAEGDMYEEVATVGNGLRKPPR